MNSNTINNIVNTINNNGVVVMPTDTVYGIVCSAVNVEAVDKAYQLKNRDYSKAMIILVSNREMLHKYTKNISKLEEELIIDSPCPTTVILKRNEELLPDILCNGTDEIAVRRPKDLDLIDIIDRVNVPVVATSANVTHSKTITDISLLDDSIKNNVDLIIDGGHIDRGASTIVKVVDDKLIILRDNESTYKLIDKYKDKII
ncbi:MAG: L-threonylcarbamoyladenylate synthase [Bacilli bacterium]|nr:L-threonylcarbamoyladenylate synthase [Bacilli bacterium]